MMDLVKSWLNRIFLGASINDYEVTIDGKSEKGDGYVGDIIFVSATSSDNSYHFVIKHGKDSSILREALPVRDAFLNEIAVYEIVLPLFKKLQAKCDNIFNAYPKYHGSLIEDNMEVLILENISTKGYKLNDRLNSMSVDHMKLVLKEYGKLHALSLALKTQQPAEFRKLVSKLKLDIFSKMLTKAMTESIKNDFKSCFSLFSSNPNVVQRLETLIDKVNPTFGDVPNPEADGMVILHGDCWNNNFMFKYDEDNAHPVDVKLLDWQLTRVNSPVYDLSYFIYATASKQQLDHFDELLHAYHDSLSSMLIQLGTNPHEVFPFSLLMVHWRKYAKFGVMLCPTAVKVCLCPKTEAPDLTAELEAGKSEIFHIPSVGDQVEQFERRVRDCLLHAYENGFI